MKKFLFLFVALLSLNSCQEKQAELPILGRKDIQGTDTIFHSIPDFQFMDQDSNLVTNSDLEDYVYLSDFFFTSCPSICPKVKKQMLKIYKKYGSDDRVKLISHTIDPVRDTPEKLKRYSSELGVDNNKWIFLTGSKDSLLEMANEYFVA